jgi:4-hydroxy-tetrahydrodipicolinate reductase
MTYPTATSPQLANTVHKLAIDNGVAVIGTGINPGFVLDLLVITLTGVCSHIESITATRVNDLSPYGPTVLKSQGVGLTPTAFQRGLEDGTVVGHIGFAQSLHMIADAIGWHIGRIEEKRAPIIAQVRRETPGVTVEPGHVAGCLHTATAYWRDTPIITLIHPQQVQPQLEGIMTGDTIEIRGTPHIRLTGSPEIPGGQATVALAVNMIPHVLNAVPGLHTMRDLPVPAAQLGDMRKAVHGELHG